LRAVVESNEGSRLEKDAVFIPFRLKMGRMELSFGGAIAGGKWV
jgi:hypothetical protein